MNKDTIGLVHEIKRDIRNVANIYEAKILELQAELKQKDDAEKERWDGFVKTYSAIKRAERIDANDLYERSSEASHYNWLDDEMEKLNLELKQKDERLEEAEGVIGFYGDGDNWYYDSLSRNNCVIKKADRDYHNKHINTVSGGKKAREYQSKYKESE